MQGFRVLVVEDDFVLNLSLSEFLRDCGFSVESVYCAAAAFEVIERGHQLSGLVTDIELGPGPDGFAVARQARARYPDVPVVFVSGAGKPRHDREGVAGSAFFDKPAQPRHILEMLGAMAQNQAA